MSIVMQLGQELQEFEQNIREFQTQAQQEMQKKQQELTSPVFEKAQNAINEVAEENNYTYIFDISLGSIVYGKESKDIMPLVKTKLGIE